MRKLLLLALMGMALPKIYYGSVVPPEVRLRAPGFTVGMDRPDVPKPRWLTHPARLHPAWMHPHGG